MLGQVSPGDLQGWRDFSGWCMDNVDRLHGQWAAWVWLGLGAEHMSSLSLLLAAEAAFFKSAS